VGLKLVQYLESSLGQALGSLTGRTFRVSSQADAAAPTLEEPVLWQQSFSVLDAPCLWIAAGKDLWEAVGRLTLEAAGLDEVTEADSRSTWHEIVNQTVAAIATGITSDLGREVTASKGEEIQAEPAEADWQVFAVDNGDGQVTAFKVAWTPELSGLGDSHSEEAAAQPAPRDNSVSKTFDLLLEVALPVSVSFGRTSLQIREVLKLNTGSIVELDRLVTDPVDVIVNDCVIARGEVVVVDGNYGVRVSHLASRDERLRTGMAEAIHKSGLHS